MTIKLGDTIRVTKQDLPFYRLGDLGIVKSFCADDTGMWVDFRQNDSYAGDGRWCIGVDMCDIVRDDTHERA